MTKLNKLTEFKIAICSALGMFGGVILDLLGGGDSFLIALIILMVIDFVTGLLLAILWGKSNKSETGKLSSKACWQGIVKKICTLLLVIVAHEADVLLCMDYVRNAAVVAFCVAEIISICENAGEMGILPKQVQEIFNRVIDLLNKKSDKKDNDNKG